MVLPINVYALSVDYSYKILPVFIGLTLGGNGKLSEKNLSLLRRFSPVGCRDERTMRMLLRKGIDAYLQGCIVATFPKKQLNNNPSTTFFVNVEKGLKDYIPKNILKDCKFLSHDYYTTADKLFKDKDIYSLGEALIQEYVNEAKLVVTSKYHSAVLCLALGIPVIMVIENNYYKYSWIEKYIPIYEPKDYGNIDWSPSAVVIPDSEKELMLRIAKKRILDTYEKYKDICTLSELRERPETKEFKDIFYGNNAIKYIEKNWDKNITIEYAFWGATDTAKRLNMFISDNYKNAKLKKVFDWSVRTELEYKEGTFVPEPIDRISKVENDDLFIFVTGNSASEAAIDLFKKNKRRVTSYYLCQRQVLEEEDL